MAATASPASSSTSFIFPRSSSPTKDALKSNPHPYAIKTTSTGVLTRSNSSHSTTSSASHHFVPSSPTKQKPNNQSRPSSHRYSRSLNTELPRPLPIPPNFPSPSPTRAEFNPPPEVQESARSGRERRADTLPSLTHPPPLPQQQQQQQQQQLGAAVAPPSSTSDSQLPHPDDPRDWTPEQLSTYLASSLRVTSGDLPPLVAKDMAAFVRTQKITGRRFLRLNETDLDKYGLNQRWQVALLNASRALRQDSLRGRIWNPAFPSEQDDEQYSSSSSSGSANDPQRDNRSGRVRGMVASLEQERSSSFVDNGGRGPSRSVSPGKRSWSPIKRTASPVKSGSDLDAPPPPPPPPPPIAAPPRSRPRPRSAIFPSHSSSSTMPSDTATATVAAAAPAGQDQPQQPVKEPRLLPYPPSTPHVLPDLAFGAPPQQPGALFPSSIPTAYGPPLPTPPPFSPLLHSSSSAFPSGVLPFSPEHTGAQMNTVQSTAPSPPTQTFDALYVNALLDNGGSVRPLPLPPHPGQIYQAPVQGYEGVVMTAAGDHILITNDDDDNDRGVRLSSGAPSSPHGIHSLPSHHVHIQTGGGVSLSGHHGLQQQPPVGGFVSLEPQPQQQPYPQQHQHHHQMVLSESGPVGLPGPEPGTMSMPMPIHAPQPRDGRAGRESPTKLLEEKLEELLEPRPRYDTLVVGQSPSRPRSRVASLTASNNNGNGNNKSRVPSSSSSPLGLPAAAAATATGMGNGQMHGHLGMGESPHNPRKRVISLSRAHSHRLSGVEAWGESHRHLVVPPDEDVHTHGREEDGMVKEMEGDEEVGIEAVLEKEVPAGLGLPLPLSLPLAMAEEGGGHSREGSGASLSGGGGGGSAGHSRAGSLREPKSAVITVVERKPSSRFNKRGKEGVEESMDVLLGKKRMVSGAEAWEMVNVDTVKHLDESGFLLSSSVTSNTSRRSIEDIFSPQPQHRPKRAEDHEQREEALKKRECEVERRERDGAEQMRKMEELDGREKELEKSVGETRKMVEVLQGRLEGVERWMEREKNKMMERERGEGNWPLGVMKVLGASRIPGMLGLSAWLGYRHPASESTPPASTTPDATALRDEKKGGGGKAKAATTLIRRFARMGVSLSTYAVLFGIGVCVVMLRVLGKRPVVKVGGTGVGVRLGVDVVGNGFRR